VDEKLSKCEIRKLLRQRLAGMSDEQRKRKSFAACHLLADAPEFEAARVLMLYLSTATEVDTSALALRAWQQGKSVVVPKMSWDKRHMLPVEISSLQAGLTSGRMGIREPVEGKPIPVDLIDLVIVPGLGFTAGGHRIGRGMGFYDRFLAQSNFMGLSCGLCFAEQIVDELPVLDHDIPLSMLVSDQLIRRFASNLIGT